MCGEKKKAEEMGATTKGSPPRMRGKECLTDEVEVVQRITPAYAGKRRVKNFAMSQIRDHPRVCGEKLVMPCQGW